MTQTTLHVEARLHSLEHRSLVEGSLTAYLRHKFVSFPIHQSLADLNDYVHCDKIKVPADFVVLEIHTYVIEDGASSLTALFLSSESDDDRDLSDLDLSCVEGQKLPSTDLCRDWDLLTFGDDLHYRLLRYITARCVSSQHISTQQSANIFLFHGPPGTGKTTLSQSLANQVAIRLQSRYSDARLLRVNAAGLLNRYVGNSQRTIAAVFDTVLQLASKGTLCFVTIDEVESIVCTRREESMNTNGNREIMRATNKFLTCLDALRGVSNVVVFCTSNLMELLDRAFVSRANHVELIDLPGLKARYDILARSLNDLTMTGSIDKSIAFNSPSTPSEIVCSPDSQTLFDVFTRLGILEGHHDSSIEALPGFIKAKQTLLTGQLGFVPHALLLAMQCQGLCGRTLSQVPQAALLFASRKEFAAHEALVLVHAALSKAIADGR